MQRFFLPCFDLLRQFSVSEQNLNKQAYDLAKALLKRTAQAIEPYITNVSFSPKHFCSIHSFLHPAVLTIAAACVGHIFEIRAACSDFLL